MLNVRELVTALRIGHAEVPCMFAIACRCSRLLPLVTMIAISLVSAGEARHWRHNGYYGFYWPDRSTRRDRAEESAPRNSPPVVQTSGFGLAVAHMIRACEEQSVELRKTMSFLAPSVRVNVNRMHLTRSEVRYLPQPICSRPLAPKIFLQCLASGSML